MCNTIGLIPRILPYNTINYLLNRQFSTKLFLHQRLFNEQPLRRCLTLSRARLQCFPVLFLLFVNKPQMPLNCWCRFQKCSSLDTWNLPSGIMAPSSICAKWPSFSNLLLYENTLRVNQIDLCSWKNSNSIPDFILLYGALNRPTSPPQLPSPSIIVSLLM